MPPIDSNYPVFVLAFCVIKKADYASRITPSLQYLKFKHWGHDMVVLHEHEIRKPTASFSFLHLFENRRTFLADLTNFVSQAPFTLFAGVVLKLGLTDSSSVPMNPYSQCLKFGLEEICRYLDSVGNQGCHTPIIVERRGKKEDHELVKEFDRINKGENCFGRDLHFEIIMASKLANCAGLQLADLVARPIGIRHLRPAQQNRAYEILKSKFSCASAQRPHYSGLRVFQ